MTLPKDTRSSMFMLRTVLCHALRHPFARPNGSQASSKGRSLFDLLRHFPQVSCTQRLPTLGSFTEREMAEWRKVCWGAAKWSLLLLSDLVEEEEWVRLRLSPHIQAIRMI